jgi:hypothetical protein
VIVVIGESGHRTASGIRQEGHRGCPISGIGASSIPTVLVQGDNRPGLGHAIAKVLGDVGINLNFVLVQVVGRKYAAVFGFENFPMWRKRSPS